MSSKVRVGAAIGVIVLLVVASIVLPVTDWLVQFIEWVRGAGTAGAAVFAVVYIISTVLMLPASLLTLGAGFVYGAAYGTAIVAPAATIGATIAFFLGRTLLRDTVKGWMEDRPNFRAVDRAIEKKGAQLVFLMRLSPVFPFNILNFSLGLTPVPAMHYFLATFIGILPGTFLFVYLGSTVADVAAIASGGTDSGAGGKVLAGVGLIATFAVVALVTRYARAELDKALAEDA